MRGSGFVADPGALDARIAKTVEIAARWGYGLSVEQLSRLLYRGSAPAGEIARALAATPSIVREGSFVTVRGRDDLLGKSVERHASNGALTGEYQRIARDFARDLLRHSPFVRAIAVSGSTASGGLGEGDDVDLNLFVENGTKYVAYLAALLLGVKYSIRHRRRFANGSSLFGLLPKVTCVNVVWTDAQCRPFLRQDEFLAFELLRSVAIAGTDQYREVLRANPWLAEHFPQIYELAEGVPIPRPPPSALARLQERVARSPPRLRRFDRACRFAARAIHRLVDLTRERKPEAVERQRFLRRVKFPYDVFQD